MMAEQVQVSRRETYAEAEYELWKHWPVNWSAISVGALSALAVTIIFGLAAIALGAHQLTPEERIVDLHKIKFTAVAISVFASFLAFVVGGWVAGKVAGILHSEPAMLHGAIVWLTVLPMLAILSGMGVGSYLGSWYGGLGRPAIGSDSVPFERPSDLSATATEQQRAAFDADWAEYRRRVAAWNADTPRAVRNSALCAASALLLGLIGSVLGGWMACGEPMSPRYRRTVPRKVK
ncbi:MAG: hypothetical protein U0136_21820 [Bdellovibrionota bacterium]